jgi:hypothetical protein
MQASIYKPAKSSMQSGTKNSSFWILEYLHNTARTIEPVMGWTSSTDMMREVKIKFKTKEEAIYFAKNNNIEYEVINNQEKKFTIRTYAENFK